LLRASQPVTIPGRLPQYARPGARLRNAVELEAVTAELLGAMQKTVAPSHATLWLTQQGVRGSAPARTP